MHTFSFIATSIAICLAILWAIDMVIPREPLRPIQKVDMDTMRILDETYSYPAETFGPPWNPMGFDEFIDFWMTLSDEDKFYTSTECWFIPEEMVTV